MKKFCWLLILVLLLGCFAGCQQMQIVPDQPTEPRPIENPDGTLSDWMKEEMDYVYKRNSEGYSSLAPWWDPENPLKLGTTMYYGTYNGYVMFCKELGLNCIMEFEISGYQFRFPSYHNLRAYKAGEFYDIEDLLEQGLIDEEAIRIAHEHYTEINEIKEKYRKQVAENE